MEYLDRLRTERNELGTRVGKLGNFLLGDAVKVVDNEELHLLREQLEAMETYLKVLNLRIAIGENK